jgi:hypothetical protein
MIAGSACHYCGEQQPKRKLRRLELSSIGNVLVCREVEPCQRRARAQLHGASTVAVAARTTTVATRRHRRRARAPWALWLGLLVLGLLVLPHLTIHGRHWHVWFLP